MHYEVRPRMVADLFSFYYSLTMQYMYVTYIILDIITNLEMNQSIWERNICVGYMQIPGHFT